MAGGLPGLRSADHVAFTVPDLGQAVAFFTEHLGAVVVFEDGPFDGPEVAGRLDVEPGTSCRLAMLRLGDRINLELFEYDAPGRVTRAPRNSDVGGHHLAFYVDDVDAARAYLRGVAGVRLMDGPNDAGDGSPVAGQRWFYLETPWGLHLEITSDTHGSFYAGLPGEGMVPPS
jgi:catechol 2,3-dioxygenase-like lactoylglutathione lyase family enzyme